MLTKLRKQIRISGEGIEIVTSIEILAVIVASMVYVFLGLPYAVAAFMVISILAYVIGELHG